MYLLDFTSPSTKMQSSNKSENIQVDIREQEKEVDTVKIRPLERVKITPLVPPEPSSYGKYANYSRPWILHDGRDNPLKGSEMRDKYKLLDPKKLHFKEGIRRQIMTNFFWEEMLEEVIDELNTESPVTEYCSEYEANYVKEDFKQRDFEVVDKDMHLRYPLYGTGSSAYTYYTEKIQKSSSGDVLEKFRRSQDFTKPMGERLDDGWVL